MSWYHGSPTKLTSLETGSTITQDRRLAEVFSHKPPLVSMEDDGTIRHSGTAEGLLYVVDEEVREEDIYAHPRSTMAPGLEWLTRRRLRVRLIGPVAFQPGEVMSEEEVRALMERMKQE